MPKCMIGFDLASVPCGVLKVTTGTIITIQFTS
jgi:hypothetical protein